LCVRDDCCCCCGGGGGGSVYVCFVELRSVLGWHAKVEEELVVCEILLTTTNLWDWVIINNVFLMTCKMKRNWYPFWLQQIYGIELQTMFLCLCEDMQNEKNLGVPFDYNKIYGIEL
jgi:hypothetical protein